MVDINGMAHIQLSVSDMSRSIPLYELPLSARGKWQQKT
jgi:hypothetical protein